MKNKNVPGELEFTVLSKLEELKSASVADLHKELPAYAYTTLLTILTRLHKKKKVSRSKSGRQHIYSLKKSSIPPILEKMIERMFGGKRSGLIQYLIDSSERLSAEELKEIEQAIERCKGE